MPIITAMHCRRARLVPNQAVRGFALGGALGILAGWNADRLGLSHQRTFDPGR